jgi:hypothetical protein
MQFISVSNKDTRSHPENEFYLGPNLSWKPTHRTELSLASLFGTTGDSSNAKIFAVFSYNFGKYAEEGLAPVSTRNR